MVIESIARDKLYPQLEYPYLRVLSIGLITSVLGIAASFLIEVDSFVIPAFTGYGTICIYGLILSVIYKEHKNGAKICYFVIFGMACLSWMHVYTGYGITIVGKTTFLMWFPLLPIYHYKVKSALSPWYTVCTIAVYIPFLIEAVNNAF